MNRWSWAWALLVVGLVAAAPDASAGEPETGERSLAGQVVDSVGASVPDAEIFATDVADEYLHFVEGLRRRVRSGPDGRFRVDHLPEAQLWVHVKKDGYLQDAPLQVASGRQDVRVVLARLARVRGAVVDERGHPVPDFEVDHQKVHAPDGRFDRPRPPKSTALTVTAQGFAVARVPLAGDARADTDLGVIHLSVGRTIEGEVVDSSGHAFSDTQLLVSYANGAEKAVQLVGKSHFKLSNVPPGPVKIQALAAYQAPSTKTVPAEATRVRFVLVPYAD